MKSEPTPLLSDLVLVGGGHAHVHALKMFGMAPLKSIIEENGIQITLISSTVLTPYSGMLPGIVSGHYTSEEIHLDLRKICSFSGIRFIHAGATGITYDSDSGSGGGWISCSDGRPDVRYDTVSIDIGSSPAIPAGLYNEIDEVETVTPVKPIATFTQRWFSICDRLKKSPVDTYSAQKPFTLLVVGAGAGGIELALGAQYAMQNILKEKSHSDPGGSIKIIMATRGMILLPSHSEGVRLIFARILKERGIDVQYGAEAVGAISEVDENGIVQKSLKLSDSSCDRAKIDFDECLWCTSAGASSWLSDKTPFETTHDGFIMVNETYESVSHKGVFSAGDCCYMVDNPRPKAGVFAVRAGPIVKDNLIAFLLNQPLTPHKPQAEFLGLISTGDKYAVASRGEHALEGEFLWRLKDEIDRGWMDMYQTLPSMEEMMDEEDVIAPASKSKNFIPPILASRGKDALAAFIEAPMRCGGCGAKVGAGTLTRVLDTVHRRRLAHSSPDASHEKKPNKIDPDDAAIVMLPKTGGGAMIQTIDFFRSFISDPFVFGKIAAVHALSDCHAMGAKAQTALALAVVKFSANEAMTERTLVDMLSGACDVLDAENCELAGGHTCEGAEQALGFAVSGFIQDPSKLLRKRGGKVGDKIILTKAIGTGALFAADMRAKCRGELVEEAIESMITSNGPASHIAMDIVEARSDENDRGIHSCTDVTGFGLCGHLLEMLVANDDLDEELDSVSASLDLNAIPFFKGAIEAVASGISSSLYRENSRSRRAVSNHEEAAKSCPAKYPLLFDPQTAGGLLFFVSPGVYEDFVQKLLDDPMTKLAAVIGELTEYTPAVSEFDVCEIDGSCTPTANRIYVNF